MSLWYNQIHNIITLVYIPYTLHIVSTTNNTLTRRDTMNGLKLLMYICFTIAIISGVLSVLFHLGLI